MERPPPVPNIVRTFSEHVGETTEGEVGGGGRGTQQFRTFQDIVRTFSVEPPSRGRGGEGHPPVPDIFRTFSEHFRGVHHTGGGAGRGHPPAPNISRTFSEHFRGNLPRESGEGGGEETPTSAEYSPNILRTLPGEPPPRRRCGREAPQQRRTITERFPNIFGGSTAPGEEWERGPPSSERFLNMFRTFEHFRGNCHRRRRGGEGGPHQFRTFPEYFPNMFGGTTTAERGGEGGRGTRQLRTFSQKTPNMFGRTTTPGGGVGSGGNLALTAMYSPNQWIHLTCQGTRMGDSGSEGPTLFATTSKVQTLSPANFMLPLKRPRDCITTNRLGSLCFVGGGGLYQGGVGL